MIKNDQSKQNNFIVINENFNNNYKFINEEYSMFKNNSKTFDNDNRYYRYVTIKQTFKIRK